MYKGFYNLTSGMLTQQRNLNVVSNNLVNVSTAGFKQDRFAATTFDQVMYNLVGNKDKSYIEIGEQSYIRAASETRTIYDQGAIEPTNIPLDFGIEGTGFFAIQGTDGQTLYTRAGSFSLDDEGYLCFSNKGRVLDPNEQEIYMGIRENAWTDKIKADDQGRIYTEDGNYLGQVGVFDFEDYDQLEHNGEGFFTGDGAVAVENPLIHWKCLERSNVDMVQQMTEMLTCQRAFQSAAEVSRMYDDVMTKAVTSVGQLV